MLSVAQQSRSTLWTNGGLARPSTVQSHPPVHYQRLPADVVAIRAAEQIDRAGRFLRRAAAAERNHLIQRCKPFALHTDAHRSPLHVDRPGLARLQRLRQARLNQTECDSI